MLTNAAGTAKTVEQARQVLKTKSPKVVLGSYTRQGREGNPGVVDYFGGLFSLNVRGIPSPPPEVWTDTVAQVSREAHAMGKQVVVSVAGEHTDYPILVRWALDNGADEVEANFGCPNMQEGARFASILSYRPHLVRRALEGSTRLDGLNSRVWAKVSPIFDDKLFADLAAVLGGLQVRGVVATNTLPQCTELDASGKPVLSFGTGLGGLGGPALKPIALAQAAKWFREGFQVIGVGGITFGRDYQHYQRLGIEDCQVNTVTQTEGFVAIDRILRECEQ